MRKRRGTAIAIALLAGMGMTAAGHAAGLKAGKQKVKELSKEEFADLRAKLGACLADKSKDMAGKLLTHSDSVAVDYAGMGVQPQMYMFSWRMDLCQKYNNPALMGPIFARPGALRTLLMESGYLAKNNRAPKVELDDKGQPVLAPARMFVAKGDQLPQAVAYAQLADCTAANGTDLADAVLRTGAGSAEERAAAVALAPVIGQCVQEGQNISLTPETIRALAAEGMWQRYIAPPAQASAK